jgi:hypothetical protein
MIDNVNELICGFLVSEEGFEAFGVFEVIPVYVERTRRD